MNGADHPFSPMSTEGSSFLLSEQERPDEEQVSCWTKFQRSSSRWFSARLALLITVLLQILGVIVLSALHRGPVVSPPIATLPIVVFAVIQLLQVALLGCEVWLLVNHIWRIHLSTAWVLWLAVILAFGGLYMLVYIATAAEFATLPSGDHPSLKEMSIIELWFTLIFFSFETQSLTGFGELNLTENAGSLLCSTQELLGVAFNIIIISQTLPKFVRSNAEREQQERLEDESQWTCWQRLKRAPIVRRLRRAIRRYLLPVAIFCQLAWICVIWATSLPPDSVHTGKGHAQFDNPALWVALLWQSISVLILVVVSVKFVQEAWRLSVSFVVQVYLANAVTFAGFYLVLFLFDPSGFHVPARALHPPGDSPTRSFTNRTLRLWNLVFETFYFAMAAQSSAGLGDVYPLRWHTRLVCMVHMALSTLFNVIVLGFGLAHIGAGHSRRLASEQFYASERRERWWGRLRSRLQRRQQEARRAADALREK